MDSDQRLLDAANAREVASEEAKWKQKKRYEGAAKEAHKVRQVHRLLRHGDARGWDDLPLVSHRHLIADAENVADNQNITADELHQLYQERLIAWGDSDSADLSDPMTKEDHAAEDQVLSRLKELLASPLPEFPVESVND